MIYLIGSIVFTSYLTISFKLLEKWNIDSFHAIVFNYLTCIITGTLFNGEFPVRQSIHEKWFPIAIVMGCSFILIFNIVALATRKNGISVATVAYKLSLVIPFIFSVGMYHEPIGIVRILGIAAALVSVILTCYSGAVNKSLPGRHTFTLASWSIPVILFISSGLLDSLLKYTEQAFLNETNNNSFLITAFFVAACVGTAIIIFQVVVQQKKISYRSVIAGIGIGIPNYFSIWCLVKALKMYPGKSSIILPVNNMGIVLFSAVVSLALFREKLSIINKTGIALAVLAIAAIAFG